MTEDREAKEVEESPDTGKIAKKKINNGMNNCKNPVYSCHHEEYLIILLFT